MVEKVFISPNRVRAYGNIVNMKTGDDFTLVNSELTVTTDTVNGAEMTVFQFEVEGGISIALVSSASTCNVGDNVLLTATVMDNNTPVEAAEVTFKVGETVLGTDETDANGVATYTYAASTAGSFSFTASYQDSTSPVVSVSVNHSYSLAFSQATYTASGGSATLECTLLEDNVAMSGASVTVTGNDSSTYTATTNSSGVASFTVTGISASTVFTATYQGATATCTVTVQTYLFYDDCSSSSGLSNYSLLTLRGSASPTLTFDSTNNCYVLTNNATSSGGHSMMAIDSLAGENSYTMQFKTKPYNTTDNGGTGYAYKGSNGMYSIYYMYKTGGSDSGNITINQGSLDSKQTNIGSNHRDEWLTHIITVSNGKVTYVLKDSTDTALYTGSAFTPSKGIQSDTKPGITILWWNTSKAFVKDIIVEAL